MIRSLINLIKNLLGTKQVTRSRTNLQITKAGDNSTTIQVGGDIKGTIIRNDSVTIEGQTVKINQPGKYRITVDGNTVTHTVD